MTGAPIRVLVVDDDFRVAGIHAAFVERTEGFEVVGSSRTAAGALEDVARLDPDLVLMDIYLPDGNGLDVVRALLERPEPPHVIVITAARELDAVRQAMQLGALHYLVKPFGYEALAEQLESYRRLRNRLDRLDDAPEQADVDELFQLLRVAPAALTRPPKGHSAPTLSLVLDAVRTGTEPMSASQVAERIGVSRVTAQRYLSYLERHGVLSLHPRYGTSGRPENRYRVRDD
jgi:response regulator of citrate/malate metabolism